MNESLLSEVDWGAHNPDAEDPEQLTGESIQSVLTFVVQLQWLVALGRLVTHAQVTTLSKLMVASCLMVDVPYLDHLWDGKKDFLDVGQVRCSHEETSRKLLFWKEIQMTSMPRQRGVTEFQPKRALSNSNPNG